MIYSATKLLSNLKTLAWWKKSTLNFSGYTDGKNFVGREYITADIFNVFIFDQIVSGVMITRKITVSCIIIIYATRVDTKNTKSVNKFYNTRIIFQVTVRRKTPTDIRYNMISGIVSIKNHIKYCKKYYVVLIHNS